MFIFVRKDSDMWVCPTAYRNNGRKAVYEELDCKRNKKLYVKVFFWLGRFFILLLYRKNYGKVFFLLFLQFYFDFSLSNRRQASSENRLSVENQPRVRAAKNNS